MTDPDHPERWNNVREARGNNEGEDDVEVVVDATGEAGTMNGIDESVHQLYASSGMPTDHPERKTTVRYAGDMMEARQTLNFAFSLLMRLELRTQECGTFLEAENVFWRMRARAASCRSRLGNARQWISVKIKMNRTGPKTWCEGLVNDSFRNMVA